MSVLATRGDFSISDDKAELDIAVIHGFLRTSYWAEGINRATVEKSIEGSDCFGLYESDQQIGFARVITDGVRFAYLADVFVLDRYQGQGLGAWLIETVLKTPAYAAMQSWMLLTLDAHAFYEQLGFWRHPDPGRLMVRSSNPLHAASQTRGDL